MDKGDIMGMMKNMYHKGDDNMKRMISESWQKGQDASKKGVKSELND